MTTLNGLPAHVLLVHFIVVLAPLTAVLAILCAVWPAARQRLVWLVVVLAATTTVLTPLTTSAGEWLEHREVGSPQLHAHTELGDTMIYFSVALVLGAVLLAYMRICERRGRSLKPAVHWLIAAVVIVASVATGVQVYRIGDSGATATWSGQMAEIAP
jgi:ABC-type branched-subunit amino acid transport system permease subunit